jgi:hypothetical protein
VVEHANSPLAGNLVAFEREIDFLDTKTFGRRAELRLRAGGASAEEDAVGCDHRAIIAARPPRVAFSTRATATSSAVNLVI